MSRSKFGNRAGHKARIVAYVLDGPEGDVLEKLFTKHQGPAAK